MPDEPEKKFLRFDILKPGEDAFLGSGDAADTKKVRAKDQNQSNKDQ